MLAFVAVFAVAACGGHGTANPAAPVIAGASPATVQTGTTYAGRNNYIEYIAGDLPVIITVPHGGRLAPSEIRDRRTGITARDLYTDDLAMEIVDVFVQRIGKRPHLIINRLHRRKLDANREIIEAANGDPVSEQAWHEFHGFIDIARAVVARNHGRGLLIDLHGHSHAIRRLELGYLLDPDILAEPDSSLNDDAIVARSSVRALAHRKNIPLAQLLRGPDSFGALLQANGYDAVPSPAIPNPGDAPYFTGGYITERHGSRSGGRIDAIQIESHYTGVRDTRANRRKFAEAVAVAIEAYLREHY